MGNWSQNFQENAERPNESAAKAPQTVSAVPAPPMDSPETTLIATREHKSKNPVENRRKNIRFVSKLSGLAVVF
jgi:hypothetical protein